MWFRGFLLSLSLCLALGLVTLFGRAISSAESLPIYQVEPLDVQQLTSEEKLVVSKTAPRDAQGRLRLIVELSSPPVVAWQLQTGRSVDLGANSAEAYRATLQAQQRQFVAAVQKLSPTALIGYQYDTLFNGVAVRIDANSAEQLATLPNVATIYPDEKSQLMLDASTAQINAPAAWATLGGNKNAGKGVKVAVIDSGAEPTSPLFAGNGYTMPAGYPKGQCVDHANFCNGKIIAARWYGELDANNNLIVPPDADPLELPDPIDRQGHGSHVSGIAVGNSGIQATTGDGITETISGVAPAAYLMVYKACWLGSDCVHSGLMKALEDAVLDGADVINNSWGQAVNNITHSPFGKVTKNATDAGVVVLFSAGNSGNAPSTVICPACFSHVIGVGSVSTNRVHANTMRIIAPSPVPTDLIDLTIVSGNGYRLIENFSLPLRDGQSISANNGQGCSAWPTNALQGVIVLIERGSCVFEVKIQNAANAGAKGVIVFDNRLGVLTVMNVNNATSIPAVMTSQKAGLQLREWATAHPDAVIAISYKTERIVNPDWADVVVVASSRGPNLDQSVLKPDLVAPGQGILSADEIVTGGTGFGFQSGTSMAVPHVSGAAALLIQQHPDWEPSQIKSALMSSAIQKVRNDDYLSQATPFDIGAGRLDLGRAVSVTATFEQSSFSEPTCLSSCVWNGTLKNVTNKTLRWTAELSSTMGLGLSIIPTQIDVGAGQEIAFTVTITKGSALPFQWNFASLKWIDNDPTSVDNYLPMAVYLYPDPNAAFEKSADYHPPVTIGDSVTYTLKIENSNAISRTWTITDPIPTGGEYVPGSRSDGLTFDDVYNRMLGNVQVPPLWELTTGMYGGYVSLAGYGLGPQACNGSCDDEWFEAKGLDILFMGKKQSSLFINTNGFVSFEEPTGVMGTPQELPNPTPPNFLIAPLWSDLDLRGDSSDTAGAGYLYVGKVTTADNPKGWTVVEWEKTQHWVDPQDANPINVNYTFQIWIANGTGEMRFSYGPLINFGLYPASIGVEGPAGALGLSSFYRDYDKEVGTRPTSTLDIKIEQTPPMELSYQVKVKSISAEQELFNLALANDGEKQYASYSRVPLSFSNTAYLPIIIR